MAIITISRGSYSRGKEVAEKVAQKLGYECIARDVLIEASQEFNVPEIKLIHALQEAPSFFNRFTHNKEKYIAYIESAFLHHVKNDNVIYHGMAGHFFVKDVPHLLKIRIIADLEDRIQIIMNRDKVSSDEAVKNLINIDNHRQRWTQHLYGINPEDPSLYDMILHIHTLTTDDAVGIICNTVALDHFKTTPESKERIEDLYLASQVKVALIDIKHDIEVTSKDRKIKIKTTSLLSEQQQLDEKLTEAAKAVSGVEEVNVLIQMDDRESYD